MPVLRKSVIVAAFLALAGCNAGKDDSIVTAEDSQPYDGIAADEEVRFSGNEPFWSGRVKGDMLTYTTPEDPDGQTIRVKRFAGMNGISFSGTLGGKPFDLAITAGSCADTMADVISPFTATLRIGEETRNGCAHTDRQPSVGPENP